jgi:Protein of unknown function (DUF2924)
VREWDGKSQRVTVLDHDFAWNGTTYRSLTEIAFAITGTAGPARASSAYAAARRRWHRGAGTSAPLGVDPGVDLHKLNNR